MSATGHAAESSSPAPAPSAPPAWTPDDILDAVRDGRSAIAPIRQWDTTGWPCRVAAEIADFNPRALVDDRKLHKLIRRTDLVGLYAAGRAIERAGLVAHRDDARRGRRGDASATAPASTSARAAATTRTSTTSFRC